jgi:hypothetical protein
MNTFNTHIRGHTAAWTALSGVGYAHCGASSRSGPALDERLLTNAVGHRLESRVRENRTHGSEGGEG